MTHVAHILVMMIQVEVGYIDNHCNNDRCVCVGGELG